MIKRKLILTLVFIVTSLFFIFSCKNGDEPLSAYGDVLIQSVQKGDSILYGVHFYVYSKYKMAKATVYQEGQNSTLTLDSIFGRFTYFYEPDSSKVKTTKPSRVKYIFNVEFDNGVQYETYDILDSTCLNPVVIKEFNFDKENDKLIIDWEPSSLADQYFVVLENEKTEIVFQNGPLNMNQTNLWINSNTDGWVTKKQPEGGEKYKAKITAIQYEPIPSAWDVQSISIAESSFVEWNTDDN